MPILKRSASLSQYVTTEKLKTISGMVCVASNQQHLPMRTPYTERPKPSQEKDPEVQPRFPEVWRDRFSASIRLTSTPEARSLTSL